MDHDEKKSDHAGFEAYQERDIGPTKDEKAQARLENMLANLQPGWKVTIIRTDPSWCRGHLETKEYYDPQEQINIGYLIDNWGGHRLHLKVLDHSSKWVGGGSISLYSYPPRVHGQEIKKTDHYQPLPTTNPQQQPMPYYQQQPAAQQPFDLKSVLDLVTKQKGVDIGGLLKVLEYAQAKQQPQIQNPMGSMAEQMLGMLGFFKEMQGFLGTFGGGGGGGAQNDGGDEFTPIIAEVVKSLVQKRAAPSIPPRGALTAPRSPAVPSPPPPAARHAPRPQADDALQGIQSLANDLSSLDAEDAAGAVLLALDKMPADKRGDAISTVLREMGGIDDDVDESLISAHTDRQGDDEEDDLYPSDLDGTDPRR